LLFVALNGRSGVSRFMTLDATTIREVVNVELPFRAPFTTQGEFFPSLSAMEQFRLPSEFVSIMPTSQPTSQYMTDRGNRVFFKVRPDRTKWDFPQAAC
jgi:hypothetical protein